MNGDVEITAGVWLRYGCDERRLHPAWRTRFKQLAIDSHTRSFIARMHDAAASPLRTRLFYAACAVLSDYDAYGLLNMYGMHLLSPEHVRVLLGASPPNATLLDVGAGNGAITDVLAPGFAQVTTTEASRVLRMRLRRRGFRVLDQDLSQTTLNESFDVIACLNVIDRCARPRTLLANLRTMLKPGGRLLLSVPLPLRPHVHVGARTVDAEEALPFSHDAWEADANALMDDLLAPSASTSSPSPVSLSLVSLSRLPYVSHGDANTSLYVLDAAVFVLQRD